MASTELVLHSLAGWHRDVTGGVETPQLADVVELLIHLQPEAPARSILACLANVVAIFPAGKRIPVAEHEAAVVSLASLYDLIDEHAALVDDDDARCLRDVHTLLMAEVLDAAWCRRIYRTKSAGELLAQQVRLSHLRGDGTSPPLDFKALALHADSQKTEARVLRHLARWSETKTNNLPAFIAVWQRKIPAGTRGAAYLDCLSQISAGFSIVYRARHPRHREELKTQISRFCSMFDKDKHCLTEGEYAAILCLLNGQFHLDESACQPVNAPAKPSVN